MSVQHDEWRNLNKPGRNIQTTDRSTAAILDKLHGKPNRDVTEAHVGVASVGTSGAKPTQPKADGGNAAANETFNQATKGPNERPNLVMIGGE